MKTKLSHQLFALLLIFSLVNEAVAQSGKSEKGNNTNAINGAWQRVYSYNGKTTTWGEPKEFASRYLSGWFFFQHRTGFDRPVE